MWYSVVFFFKQKTAYEMRISDWSSDVCSSDLLDAVRALVNHIQAVVPPILFHGEIPGVAIAAQHLDGQAVGFETPFARPALGHRREQFEHEAGARLLRLIARALFIHQACAKQGQGQAAFAQGFLGQQRSEEHTSELQSLMRTSYAA